MQARRNIITGEIIIKNDINELGSSYFTENWVEASQLEIDNYDIVALQEAKTNKIDELCLAYDNSYVVKLQWTFNGIADYATLRNRAYPVDNRTYATARITNFRDQIIGSATLASDSSVIDTYQTIYGRNPVQSDFYRVPLHKYTDGRVKYLTIKVSKTSDFLTMCNNFLNEISINYTNGYQPFNYYMLNQFQHAENINNCTTIEQVNQYTYSIAELILNVNSDVIENVFYA